MTARVVRVKLNVTVTPEMRKALKVRAAQDGRTLEELVEAGLRGALEGYGVFKYTEGSL